MSPQSPSPGPPTSPPWLSRKGELARAIAEHPWSRTPLGPLASWPAHLRVAVNLALEAAVPMALVWGPDARLIYNDAYATVIQDRHPAALGSPGAVVFAESWPDLAPLFAQAMNGEAVLIDDFALQLTRAGRTSTAFFSFSYNPIRGEAGTVDGFLCVVVETTARVVREQARAETFDTVLSAITDFAYTFDRDGRFLFVNRALLDLWGLRLEDAVGKNFFDLKYPDELASRLQRQIQQVIADRATVRDETRYVSPTGVDAYYEYIFSPVFAADGSVRIVAGSTRDITTRKKLETDATAAAQAKDDFLATLSHELRTPLNPVLLLATDAAENPELPPAVRADFKAIADNVALEARLIDDLLDISRITHDKFPLNRRPQDLHALLRRAIDSVRPELEERGQDLVTQFDAHPATVHGDDMRLQQVFWNLVRNAVKFTPPGGRVTVSTHIDPTAPGFVFVAVSDTGMGLTEDELARIFRPFAQGDHVNDGAGRFGGLGLGLAISFRIAEMHGGSLTAESRGRNQGATFTVRLALGVPDASSSTGPPERPKAARDRSAARRRVLLVEDHAPSRIALTRLLVARNIDVTECDNAEGATRATREESFDLVISDIGLPDRSGYDLMAALKAEHGCQGIALSGYGSEDDIARGRDAGFVAHLTKPVQVRDLDHALEKFLFH